LSAGVSFVSATSSAGTYTQTGNTLTFQLDSLAVSGVATMSLVLQPLSIGTVTNSASVYSAQDDVNLGNNFAASTVSIKNVRIDAANGDWSQSWVRLLNTPEADVMVRSGDIDNLNFGWPAGFDPFSGNSTPSHGFPWTVDSTDASGTDRIMVGSGYNGHPPKGQDGYANSTSRPDNLPQPIILSNSVSGLPVSAAVLQLFVDDFQAPLWGASYQVLLNGVRAPFLEDQLNQLVQTGPIGRLLTVQVPPGYLGLVSAGDVSLFIDDPTTGAGDGYAVDFVKLLLNPHGFSQIGTIQGTVRDSLLNQPVAGALLSAAGGVVQTSTDAQGTYTLTNVPAGLVFVASSKFGYAAEQLTVNLVAGATLTLDFQLTVVPELRILGVANGAAVLRWPAPLSNWILEETPALSGGQSAWAEISVSRSFVEGETQALAPVTTSTAFYRLRKP